MLRAKGVCADDPEMQRLQFRRLRDPSCLEDARDRLLKLTRSQHDVEFEPESLHRYTPEEFPGHTVYMIDKPRTLVQRHQLTGLCYLHAPASARRAVDCCALTSPPVVAGRREVLRRVVGETRGRRRRRSGGGSRDD